MLITVDTYMQRIQTAMRGMLYPLAEQCRLNYWKRLITHVREAGLIPSWDDFERYLKFIPSGQYPAISEDEFDRIIAEVDCPCEVRAIDDHDLRVLILEQAFKDYMERTSAPMRYLSEDACTVRLQSFWRWYFILQMFSTSRYTPSTQLQFIDRYQVPSILQTALD